MPKEITLSQIPAGHALESKKGPGLVEICTRGFVSSEDGNLLIEHLEGFPSQVLGLISPHWTMLASNLNHMLVIIRRDGSATAYVNELSLLVRMQIKKNFAVGQAVFRDDIADVERMRLLHDQTPVQIPQDAGVIFVFPVGWRRGYYYDFSPLGPDSQEVRQHDIEVLFGSFYAQLMFQARFKMSGNDWQLLLGQRWFPFIGLKYSTIQSMLEHVRNGWEVDEMLDLIFGAVAESLPGRVLRYADNPHFKAHHEVIRKASERYAEKDFVSAISILYPRIEGILRTYGMSSQVKASAGPNELITAAVTDNPNVQHAHSLLMPARFHAYLKEIFFEGFDPRDPQKLSRHTVAHGVAPPDLFNMKGATLGFLILEQLFYYLAPNQAVT